MIDFTPWNDLLHQYVDEQGRVDYQAWKQYSEADLLNWLQQPTHLDLPITSDSNQVKAFWLNLYNALTIAQVLQKYPIASIQPKFLGFPNWIAFLWFFLKPIHHIGDSAYSLNTIEHKILRKTFADPRIHFALVCASIGCPLLRAEAYMPETLDTQLEEDAKRFINNSEKVYYNATSNVLFCSKIFKWYRQDFLTLAPSIAHYISTYLDAPLQLNQRLTIQYLPYDWYLNQKV
jgi:Protein of unknown function, DUF547